ncbi:hypothetical protein ACVII0_005406 [Sinorhizobium meliloti]|nr:hypothetical protein T190_08125 [Sinorhizobium meliloti CCBAU 01290]
MSMQFLLTDPNLAQDMSHFNVIYTFFCDI